MPAQKKLLALLFRHLQTIPFKNIIVRSTLADGRPKPDREKATSA
jgi:arylamine N-acetyltransferase